MSTHHMTKKSKLNDDISQVIFEYSGQDVPENATHVRFHPSVVKVDNIAFEERSELVEVVLNNGLREIGESAFQYCKSLQSINIPSTVTKIGKCAFYGCDSLREVVLNEGLREIGESAFHNCTSTTLQRIVIPSTVTKISYSAFRCCTNLRDVVLNNGLKEIGSNAFDGCSSLGSITIPSTVIEIDQHAFYSCTNLREIVLNDGLKRIERNAFGDCTSLECINIPSTVEGVDQYAFGECGSLREIVIHNNERVQHVVNVTAFKGCSSLERFKFPSLFTRLYNVIEAGQRDLEAKMDDILAVEWRGDELVIPTVHREIEDRWGEMENVAEVDKEKLNKVERLISYHEMKEATTLFELALWKVKIDQGEAHPINREAYRIEVPGPVKGIILQHLL